VTALVARPARDRFAGKREQSVALVHFRLMVVMLMFAGITAVILFRLAFVWAFSDPGANEGRLAGLAEPRANLVDRNGVVLAGTIDAWKIGVHPQKVIGDRGLIAVRLAQLMPERSEQQYRDILFSKRKFFYLKHEAMPELVNAVNDIGEPGIVFERESRRYYPQGSLAAHVVGWIDRDGNAASGMELALDKQLREQAAQNKPVALSIDSRVQGAMENALAIQVTKHSAVGAAGIVLDVHTGEVLAMASLPQFNPNAPGLAPAAVDPLHPDARFNRAISSVYELGSTFKMITVANAIQQGVVKDIAHRYDATAPLHVGKYTIHDDHPQRRWLTAPEILMHSSNIGTARIADELGQQRVAAFFRQLGLDRPADLELGARGKPLWPGYWARTTVMTTAYGHGIAVSQLHLANAYAALINGGILRPATLLKRDPDHVPQGTRVISPQTSARMRQFMRLVVTMGTGRSANVPGFRIGGKTGTSEKNVNGRYIHNSLVTTFAAAFPMDAPRYVVIVTMDEPKGIPETFGLRTAAWTALPAVKNVIARVGPLLGVIPDNQRDVDVSDLMPYIRTPDEKGGHAAD
jgi:cell division protein FtsI (penicillin-binding protein 3)